MKNSYFPHFFRSALLHGAFVMSLASCGGKSSQTISDDDGETGGSGAGRDGSGGSAEGGGGDETGGRSSSGGKSASGETGGTSPGGAEGTGATAATGGSEASGGRGEDGEDGAGGVDGTGGADATGGADGTGGKGGASNSNPGVQTLGDACELPGALACAGERQKLQLLCDGDTWVQNGTCSGAEVCDTSVSNRGSCQEQPEACIDQPSETTFCAGQERRECGPDGLGWNFLEFCDGLCEDGECIFGNQYPNTAHEFFDCNGDCGPLGGCTEPHSNWSCGYFLADETMEFPVVVRTQGAPDACHEDSGDTCTDQIFMVRFNFPSDSHYVKLPDGVEARVGIDPIGDGVGADGACYSKNELEGETGCVTIPSSHYISVVSVYSPEGSGPLNLEIGEGNCPK